jgi:cell division protein FtsB
MRLTLGLSSPRLQEPPLHKYNYVDEQKQQINKLKTENTKLITKIHNLDNLLDQLVEKKIGEERQEPVMVQ